MLIVAATVVVVVVQLGWLLWGFCGVHLADCDPGLCGGCSDRSALGEDGDDVDDVGLVLDVQRVGFHGPQELAVARLVRLVKVLWRGLGRRYHRLERGQRLLHTPAVDDLLPRLPHELCRRAVPEQLSKVDRGGLDCWGQAAEVKDKVDDKVIPVPVKELRLYLTTTTTTTTTTNSCRGRGCCCCWWWCRSSHHIHSNLPTTNKPAVVVHHAPCRCHKSAAVAVVAVAVVACSSSFFVVLSISVGVVHAA